MRRYVRPDALLLRMRSMSEGMCIPIPLPTTANEFAYASSNRGPDAEVMKSICQRLSAASAGKLFLSRRYS
jgi:hypothetical protein